jgi:hypothetical protein
VPPAVQSPTASNVTPTGRLSPYPGREHSDANRDPGNESCNTIGRTVYNAAERELHRPLVVAKLRCTAASSAFSKACSWRPPSNRRSGSHWANDIAHLGCISIVVIANSCGYRLRMKTSAGSLNRELNLRTCSSVSFLCPARNIETALSDPNSDVNSRCVRP